MLSPTLNKLYHPSKWSHRFSDPDEVLHNHVDFVQRASAHVVTKFSHKLDISYGQKSRQKYDIFGTDLPDNAPLFIFIHGGYWSFFDRESSRYPVESLLPRGIKVLIPGYTLAPEAEIEDIIKEIQTFMKHCIQYATEIGSMGIYVSGHSAGAHLSASLLSDFLPLLPEADAKIFKAFFLISGIYDLVPLVRTTVNELLNLNVERAIQLSPMYKTCTELKLKIYLIVGEHDSPAFVAESQEYNNVLRGNQVHLTIIRNTDHFKIVEDLTDAQSEVARIISNNISLDYK